MIDMSSFNFTILASAEAHKELIDTFNTFFNVSAKQCIDAQWVFTSDMDFINYLLTSIVREDNFYPALYPTFDAYKLMADFQKSAASTLILLGPPGTGKTSFIREYLFKHKICEPRIVYDEYTSSKEKIYIDFMSSRSGCMIFEDADNLISDRITDNNKHMAKILNVSNGLVTFPNKKFIFTANLKDESDIDSALTRPGRCFDIVKFRALTQSELLNFTKETGIVSKNEGESTIAEIFNSRKPRETFKVGFR